MEEKFKLYTPTSRRKEQQLSLPQPKTSEEKSPNGTSSIPTLKTSRRKLTMTRKMIKRKKKEVKEDFPTPSRDAQKSWKE